MKNLHILPTDKPSRLWTNNLRRRLELDEFPSQHPTNIAKHIYITSDEEIKEGDYYLPFSKSIIKNTTKYGEIGKSKTNMDFSLDYVKKIILTTDPKLIKDGVQAIDDKFLEWICKNPSCEEVDVQKWFDYESNPNTSYKIIIPKQNLNKEPLEEITEQIQNECHSFVESVPNVSYQDATNTFLFMKLAELTLKLKKHE